MYKGYKILLLPNKEQEELMWKQVNASRFIYNLYKDIKDAHYKYYKKNISNNQIRKYITELKHSKEYDWLNEISSNVIKQATKDCERSYRNFFDKISNYPRFKTKKKSKNSFYVNYESLNFKNGKVKMEKFKEMNYKSNYNINFEEINKFMDPRCSFDGKYWYLSFVIEFKANKEKYDTNDINNENQIIGIDLGIENLMICSNNDVYININKTVKIKRIEKKLKRLQRKISRKYIKNKQRKIYIKTNNIIKLEKQIRLLYRKIINIRLNHIYQCINSILKTKPKVIVLEDLDISWMIKNKYHTNSILSCLFYKIREIFTYKCEWNGINLVIADRFYPSSQICSHCGKNTGKKSVAIRHFTCPFCNTKHNRDLNAAKNLQNYGIEYLNLNIK